MNTKVTSSCGSRVVLLSSSDLELTTLTRVKQIRNPLATHWMCQATGQSSFTGEQNHYLSTATTTLCELVSPTDSWKLAICLLSTPPLTKLPETQCTKSTLLLKQSSI